MSDIDNLVRQHAVTADDKIELLQDLILSRRQMDLEKSDLEERLKQLNEKIQNMDFERLPEAFAMAGVDHIGVAAQGNFPACEAKLKDYYRANIAAGWEPERRDVAFKRLDDLGLGALVKYAVTCQFDRGERVKAEKLMKTLEDKGIGAKMLKEVHWKSLTGAIREMCETNRKPSDGALDEIGAYVGKIVDIKVK